MAKGPAARARIAWKAFGKDVRAVRSVRGMSLRKTAEILGVDKATLSRAENGKPIQPAIFVWLADWAGHPAHDYLAPLYTRET